MWLFFRALFLLIAFAVPVCAQYNFVSIEYPGAAVTYAMDINDNGKILGVYLDNDFISHPFFYANGTFKPIGTGTVLQASSTEAFRLNNHGDVVGDFLDLSGPAGATHGYILKSTGELVILDFPGADYTQGFGINEAGVAVGWFGDLTDGLQTSIHGYRWDNGIYTPINHPDAAHTAVMGINNRGDIIGWKADVPFQVPWFGFVLSKTGFSPISSPDEVEGGYLTTREITNSGWVAGGYLAPDLLDKGFISKGNTFISINYPDAIFTHVMGMNEAGQLVGVYSPDFISWYGFVAQPIGENKPAH